MGSAWNTLANRESDLDSPRWTRQHKELSYLASTERLGNHRAISSQASPDFTKVCHYVDTLHRRLSTRVC